MFFLLLKSRKYDNENLKRGPFGRSIGFSKLVCKARFLKGGIFCSALRWVPHLYDFMISFLGFPLPGNPCPHLPTLTIFKDWFHCHPCRRSVLVSLVWNDPLLVLNSCCVCGLIFLMALATVVISVYFLSPSYVILSWRNLPVFASIIVPKTERGVN